MTTVISFVFVLGVLIFIHELGHFLVAKWMGVRVEKFSLGFPPNIFSRQYGDTTYCVGLIPLGGYVKMAGDSPGDNVRGAPDEFYSKPVLPRAAIIFAGPFMNYVLAIVLLIGIFMFSGTPLVDQTQVVVGEVSTGAPAEQIGLGNGDIIIAIDDHTVTNFDSLRSLVYARPAQEVKVTWVSGGDTLNRAVTTIDTVVLDREGQADTIGLLGFTQQIQGYQSHGVGEAFEKGFITAHIIVYETVAFVKRFVTGEVSPKLIGGPLFIAQQSGRKAREGAASLFFFMALLSVNLAVINVLPIPVLDGGHLVFLLVEKIRGAPLSVRALARAQQVGMLVLLTLIVFVTYNDIVRVISGN